MFTVTHKTIINAPLDKVEKWFREGLIDSYTKIHPQDHKELKLLTDKPMRAGSILFFKESISGSPALGSKIVLTEVSKSSFYFKCLFPYNLIKVEGEFRFRQIDQNETEMVAVNYIGHSTPVVSKILDWFVNLVVSSQALQKHMEGEDTGIKREIEHWA
jgi:hypothetical protein